MRCVSITQPTYHTNSLVGHPNLSFEFPCFDIVHDARSRRKKRCQQEQSCRGTVVPSFSRRLHPPPTYCLIQKRALPVLVCRRFLLRLFLCVANFCPCRQLTRHAPGATSGRHRSQDSEWTHAVGQCRQNKQDVARERERERGGSEIAQPCRVVKYSGKVEPSNQSTPTEIGVWRSFQS